MTLTRALQVLASVHTLDRRDGGFDLQAVVVDPWPLARVTAAELGEAWAVVRRHAAVGAGDAVCSGPAIREVVARHFGLTLNEITSYTQTQRVVRARRIGMFVCVDYGGLGPSATGRLFRRDHSTVIIGVEAVRWRMVKDRAFAAEIATIIRVCQEEHDEAQDRIEAAQASAAGGGVAPGTWPT